MDRPRCAACNRPLKHPSPSGYGPECAEKHGLKPKRRRPAARPRVRRLKPAPAPPDPDALPGQTEMALFFHQPTLDSL